MEPKGKTSELTFKPFAKPDIMLLDLLRETDARRQTELFAIQQEQISLNLKMELLMTRHKAERQKTLADQQELAKRYKIPETHGIRYDEQAQQYTVVSKEEISTPPVQN